MTKILFVIWSLERGGAERFLVSLLKTIDRSKIYPTVCCLNWKGTWAQELEQVGIDVIALDKKGKFDFTAFRKLVSIIKKGRYKIVNTHLWAADVFGRLAAIIAGVPNIISTAQNVDIWKKWWHRLIDRILSFRTIRIIAVSEAVKDYYHKRVGIPDEKIVIIPNAIETDKFENINNCDYLYKELALNRDNFVLSCVGRLTEQKGQKYLLESVDLLKNRFPNLRVLFVGNGEDQTKLTSLAGKLSVSGMVRFLGSRKDIPEILSISQGLVLPSLYEGLPLCVLEAMAANKPVIATRVGGIPELIIDGKTGILVPPRDSQALSSAIATLVNSPKLQQDIGNETRRLVRDKFSIGSITKQTTDLFLALTSK